jgi:hypothetical protein
MNHIRKDSHHALCVTEPFIALQFKSNAYFLSEVNAIRVLVFLHKNHRKNPKTASKTYLSDTCLVVALDRLGQ